MKRSLWNPSLEWWLQKPNSVLKLDEIIVYSENFTVLK